jgi:hypothetical protein
MGLIFYIVAMYLMKSILLFEFERKIKKSETQISGQLNSNILLIRFGKIHLSG